MFTFNPYNINVGFNFHIYPFARGRGFPFVIVFLYRIYFYILVYLNIYSKATKDNRVPKIFLSGKVDRTALSGRTSAPGSLRNDRFKPTARVIRQTLTVRGTRNGKQGEPRPPVYHPE